MKNFLVTMLSQDTTSMLQNFYLKVKVLQFEKIFTKNLKMPTKMQSLSLLAMLCQEVKIKAGIPNLIKTSGDHSVLELISLV